MDLLCDREAACLSGGHRPAWGRGGSPMASVQRGRPGRMLFGNGGLSGLGNSITTNVNQFNIAINIIFNGGSIVNNQLNGIDLSVSA
jgi:hypothetical protein